MIGKNKRLLHIQESIIVVLMVLLIFVTTGTVTYAIYSRFESASNPLRLANPVQINILTDNVTGNIPLDNVLVYPGSQFEVTLGFVLGNPEATSDSDPTWSSPAFILSKVEFTSEVPTNTAEQLVIYETNDQPDPDNWVLVDFNYSEDGSTSDIWYLYIERINDGVNPETVVAKEITNGEQIIFINGYLKISEQLTREYANKEINLTYYVSAIQTANVPNPLQNTETYTDEIGRTASTLGKTIYKGVWPQETWSL